MLATWARDEHLELLRALGAAVPVRAPADGWTDPWRADAVRGASAASARPTSRSPRLGRRAAVAIQNAWLHESTQQAAREAEETAALLDTILQTAPVGFAFHDNELRFLRINDALAEMNGVPVEEHIGRSPADILPASGRRSRRFREILRTGLPVIDEESAARRRRRLGGRATGSRATT